MMEEFSIKLMMRKDTKERETYRVLGKVVAGARTRVAQERQAGQTSIGLYFRWRVRRPWRAKPVLPERSPALRAPGV